MKKLLFFAYTLDMGGAERVLVDFLKILNSKYDIDLVLIKAKGELINELPKTINVTQLRNGLFSYILFRYIPFFRKIKINKIANSKDYDVAIGFIEGRSATWVADINKNIRKIAWVHNDVNHFDIGISEKEILSSYPKMDKIIVVADQSKRSFAEKYSINPKKIQVLYNLIDVERILELSKQDVPKNDCFTFVNVGRMRPQKRQDRLIRIAENLKQKGYKFKIQILGDGPEEDKIKNLVFETETEDVVELKGLVLNPYPYIKQADCVVVSSDFEGYSIAIKEALLLKKIIISTDVSGVREIFENDKFGIVSERNTESLQEKMEKILDNKINTELILNNLENFDCGNNEILEKLFKLIEG